MNILSYLIILSLIVIFFPYKKVLRFMGLKVHVWKYYGRSTRKCKYCGKYEGFMHHSFYSTSETWGTIYPLINKNDECWF